MGAATSDERREAFYRAALLGLKALDDMEGSGRRLGPDADARWQGFRGHLGLAERLDLLIRDAAVVWRHGFSPSQVFGLPGLAADEPFGPDWRPLPEHEARRLWRSSMQPTSIGQIAAALGIGVAPVSLPAISASTRLNVAGGAAVLALAEHFAAQPELSWSDQVLVVASTPAVRQLAGLMAPLVRATGPTKILTSSEDVATALRAAGVSPGATPVISDDAAGQDQAFARRAALGG
jgi:hypothetical protein